MGICYPASHGHPHMLQCVAVRCRVLQCVAVFCSVEPLLGPTLHWKDIHTCCSVLQCAAVCCSVLQCVVVCCGVLWCVAVCCNVRCVVSTHVCTSREYACKSTGNAIIDRRNDRFFCFQQDMRASYPHMCAFHQNMQVNQKETQSSIDATVVFFPSKNVLIPRHDRPKC